jgi:hypothetical protein
MHNPIKNSKNKIRFSVINDKKIIEKLKNDGSEKLIFKYNSNKKLEDLNKYIRSKNKRKTVNNVSNGSKNFKLFLKVNNKNDKKGNKFRRSPNPLNIHNILNKNYFKIFGNKIQISEGIRKTIKISLLKIIL